MLSCCGVHGAASQISTLRFLMNLKINLILKDSELGQVGLNYSMIPELRVHHRLSP